MLRIRPFCVVLSLLIIALLLLGQESKPTADFVIENHVAVSMRDGVVLRADVWRPKSDQKLPVLVYRTPYNRKRSPEDYTIFRKAVQRGYVVVMQDVRGRYGSDGEFRPYEQEGRDGHDTIEWAARQPWSNGTVGTFGLSYPGAVQWLAAMEHPPHLKAMVPAMTFATPRNFFYSGGVWDLSWPTWIWNNIAPDARVRKNLPGPRNYQEAREAWKQLRKRVQSHLPLLDMQELKEVAPFYYDWLGHPPEDDWWEFAELRDKYDRTDAAVLNFSGWYDEAYGPDGALNNYSALVKARNGAKRTAVIMGPWVHGVPEPADTKSGEREFGKAASFDYDETVLRWMDHHLKGIDNGVDREKPVKLFVMGANRWREEYEWPLKSAKLRSLYLTGGTKNGGQLQPATPRDRNRFSEFASDPANPVIEPHESPGGAMDYRVLAQRQDVLVFDTEPLREDTEVTGPIMAEIYLSVDAPDTDLWVRLMDVAPDGTAYNLMAPGLDVIRASYRNGGRRELLRPGQIYKLTLNNLLTSNLFRKGHRIRAQISTAFFPHFSRNLHTGELEATSAKMRKAKIRIYHDRDRQSRLVLPVIPQ
jgi:putative CocE/NonD family hydrolase